MSDRLRTKDISAMFNIKESTLRNWRRIREYDKQYPRFHKLTKRFVYYVESEFRADLEAMEAGNRKAGMVV